MLTVYGDTGRIECKNAWEGWFPGAVDLTVTVVSG